MGTIQALHSSILQKNNKYYAPTHKAQLPSKKAVEEVLFLLDKRIQYLCQV